MGRTDRLRALAALAESQDGVFHWPQAVGLGFSTSALSRLVGAGVVRKVHPRVYAFGHRALTLHGRWRAGVMAAGEGAVLGGATAAAAHGLVRSVNGPAHVIVAGRAGLKLPGVVAHRYPLERVDWGWWRGMRVASVSCALVDMAEDSPEPTLVEAFEQAMMQGVYREREVLARMEACRGRAGLGRLQRVLASLDAEPPGYESRGERRAAELLRAAGLPPDDVAHWIEVGPDRWRRADLWYADVRLDLEIDGPRHRLPHRRRADRMRDAELQRVGVGVERQPDELVWQQPAVFVAAVADRLARLRAQGLAA